MIGWIAFVIGFVLWGCLRAQAGPLPVPKQGTCPSGYYTSGNFCAPMAGTQERALPKAGSCPSGWFASGGFCKEMKGERR
jgi:hypothetical protein